MAKKIELTHNKFALVDDSDYEFLSQYKWHVTKKGYAARNAYLGGGRLKPKRKTIYMHNLIIDAPYVDHINRNSLDNRRSNLRQCTHKENMWNKSIYSCNKTGFKGVHFNKRDKKYQANIRVEGKLKWLGYHENAIDAANAYDKAAKKYFGAFANLNFKENI